MENVRNDDCRVGVVILTWNSAAVISDCVSSVLASDLQMKVCVVDNGSTDGTPELVAKSFPDVELIQTGENLGYAGGNNVGISELLRRGMEYIFVLNPDAVVEPGTIGRLLARADADRELAAVSPVITYRDSDRIWYGGSEIDWRTGETKHSCEGQLIGSVSVAEFTERFCGCAALLRSSVLARVGLFDERFFLYFEDTELSVRMQRAGFKIGVESSAVCRHANSTSTGGGKSGIYQYYMTRNRLVLLEENSGMAMPALLAVRLAFSLKELAIVFRKYGVRAARDLVGAHVAAYRDYSKDRFGRRR
jgi:GT2 family glycosyltransferase